MQNFFSSGIDAPFSFSHAKASEVVSAPSANVHALNRERERERLWVYNRVYFSSRSCGEFFFFLTVPKDLESERKEDSEKTKSS